MVFEGMVRPWGWEISQDLLCIFIEAVPCVAAHRRGGKGSKGARKCREEGTPTPGQGGDLTFT